METTYRVGKRRMYLQIDDQGLLIDLGNHLQGPDVIEIEALDVTTDGPTHYDGRRLNLDADALANFITYLHMRYGKDSPKALHDRILDFFPGSAYIDEMIRGLGLVYVPGLKGTGPDAYFAGCARRQLDRWAGVD